ncbi:MAG: hypothetical protein EXS15_07895 [Phycisphaerales bacterium]|nr:hypothetical protein [Phycisphaerales bacterium]
MNESRFLSVVSATSALLAISAITHGQSPTTDPESNRGATGVTVDVASARRDFFATHEGAEFFERGDRITRVYGRAVSTGRSPSESASQFLRDHADIWGVRTSDILPTGAFQDAIHAVDVYWDEATQSFRFTLLGYSQVVRGIPVFRGSLKLLMRNDPGFPLVLASSELRDLGAFPATIAAPTTLASFDSRIWSSRAIRATAIAQPTDAQLVIFAGVDDSPASPTLAVSFIVERGVAGADLSKMLYVVEATTGTVLFEEEQICNADITGTVQGLATTGWGADACASEVATGLPYARIDGNGTTVYADGTGAYLFPYSEFDVVTLTSNLAFAGKYFVVNDVVDTELTLSESGASGDTVNFLHNSANLTEQARAQVNTYLHANMCRDYITAANPAFPGISQQQGATAFQINVSVTGTCNAYYNGPSINFYSSGGGCNNTGFSTVVHHEYGHHMVSVGGSGQGAYGEGMGDVMGALISENPVLGIGFQNCSNGIRNAANSCQYLSTGCSSCGSEIHACGQLLSGCVWDTRANLAAVDPNGFRTIIRNLTVNSVLLHTGTTIAGDITIDYLTLDDDNAYLDDGTPHYAQINGAFSAHGLPGPPILPLRFTIPNGIPAWAIPYSTLGMMVYVTELGAQPQPNTGKLYWRVGGGSFQSVVMTPTSATGYSAQIPMAACGTPVDYYFEASTTAGATARYPTTAPASYHSTVGGWGVTTAFTDAFQYAGAWVVGASGDTATTGIWERVDPIGTAAQPEDDHSLTGTICYITGQGATGGTLGAADVDGGATTLTSPSFNAATSSNATLSYWRWYSNNAGPNPNADTMTISISNDDGTSWTTLEVVSENAGAWVQKMFRIADFVPPTTTMKVRFVPSDVGSGSIVEAGVDDFVVGGVNCTPPPIPADLNGDGRVDGVDLTRVLSGWGALGGDINHDGSTDGGDLAALLSAWTG